MLVNLNPVATNNTNPIEDVRGSDVTTAVSVTTTLSVLLPANPARAAYSVINNGPGTVYLRENATVTASIYKVAIPPGYMWKEDFSGTRYLGAISAITGSGTAALQVSESALA